MSVDPPVINLADAPGQREAWNRPKWMIYAWAIAELLFVSSAWQPSSGIRARLLRKFGAEIGNDVIIRPRVRIKFPWNLTIGDRSWIGEGVWIHNQDDVRIGSDVVISQETFITTGTHAHKTDMALITKPVTIEDGAWVTSRCTVLADVTIGRSALVTPNTVVRKDVPAGALVGTPAGQVIGQRFDNQGTYDAIRVT